MSQANTQTNAPGIRVLEETELDMASGAMPSEGIRWGLLAAEFIGSMILEKIVEAAYDVAKQNLRSKGQVFGASSGRWSTNRRGI